MEKYQIFSFSNSTVRECLEMMPKEDSDKMYKMLNEYKSDLSIAYWETIMTMKESFIAGYIAAMCIYENKND